MEYFTEYFAETDENEAKKLMDELGTPKEAACDIISNILEKKIDEKKQADSEKKQVDSDKKSVFGALWIALLAIFALPVATPLLISGLIVMFCVLSLFFPPFRRLVCKFYCKFCKKPDT